MKQKAYIVAELSANHGHDISIAKKSILAAKNAGVDAIKLQTYTADTLTINCDNEFFTLNSGTIWDGTTLYDLYKQAYTPWEWHDELFAYARELGIDCFSTPFDKTAVDFLAKYNMPYYKIASFELVDIPLVEYVAKQGKPMIMSTGIATLEEIDDAVNACRAMGNDDITLLKCTSSYPANIKEANLLDIPFLKNRYGLHIGLSDHTEGSIAAQVSIGLGATIFEKHFILDKSIGGPDASFSVDERGLKEYVSDIRNAELALGTAGKDFADDKKPSRQFARSLFVVENIKAGEIFTEKNVRSIRPGYGISPKFINEIIGHVSDKDIPRGTPVTMDMLPKQTNK